MAQEFIKKICLLGDGAVGKTSLIRRYVYDIFDDRYIATIGTKVTKRVVTVNEKIKLTLLIYDILGQKRYNRLHSVYYRGASGALIVSDLTRKETIKSMRKWAQALFKVTSRIPVVFIGNKLDLEKPATRAVEEITKEFKAPYLFTSAKTGENVEEAFLALSKLLLKVK